MDCLFCSTDKLINFFKSASTTEKPRLMQGLGDRSREFIGDRFIRESIVVSVHTRNIES